MTNSTEAPRFRADIEGLRAVAVVLVVLYHGGLAVIPGAYVGVDVFFVVSRFLITGVPMSEYQRAQRISVLSFYARRIRRLLPAAVLVLLATLVIAKVALPRLLWTEIAKDAMASSVHLSNMWFG